VRALAAVLMLLATPAAAQPRLTDAQVRTFVTAQERAWNAGDLAGYFRNFTPEARFTDQAYVGDKPPVPYGTSTLAQAHAQARKSAKAKPQEAGRITRVTLAPDGRTARVESILLATVGARRLCASRQQTLVLVDGAVRSQGQTDTYVRCRGG